jgi:hypothetical protein
MIQFLLKSMSDSRNYEYRSSSTAQLLYLLFFYTNGCSQAPIPSSSIPTSVMAASADSTRVGCPGK